LQHLQQLLLLVLGHAGLVRRGRRKGLGGVRFGLEQQVSTLTDAETATPIERRACALGVIENRGTIEGG